MLKDMRSLNLTICDYENNAVCALYDNTADLSGQATDVYVKTERNGWKELSFKIPSTCFTAEGEEENYRLQYLIADYRIRLITDKETDWYLISENKIIHDKKAKNVEVTAGHICQLLKTKNLDLEFSDEEGNNVGTAEQLLTTILEGTGWTVGEVAEFYEDDGETIKKRSLNAASNTGAFRLIEDMCELFDAKPIYHGEGRIIDIVPMNPFSEELEPGEIPKEVYNDIDVLEIHYDKNLKNITRTVNTENLITRLYAYGSYGDENGLCSIQTCSHEEYSFTISQNYSSGTEFGFKDKDGAAYYFTIDEVVISGTELLYSKLDFMSRSYIWNKSTGRAYHIYKTQNDTAIMLTGNMSTAKNFFPFLLSFDYYEKVGLLSENMFQQLAAYQQNMPEYYRISERAAKDMIANEQLLSETLESNTGMAKLAVKSYTQDSAGKIVLNLDTNLGDHGVLYRTDYDEAKRNYFIWHRAKELKDNGDPVSGIGSVVYIVHNTNPITWHIAYVKNIMDDNGIIYINDEGEAKDYNYGLDQGEPGALTLHLNRTEVPALQSTDRFYLFCSMSMSGRLSAKQVNDEAVLASLQNETTVATEKHPTYFRDWKRPNGEGETPSVTDISGTYGWFYKQFSETMDLGELYFCFGSRGDSSWKRVYLTETAPAVVNDAYYFNLRSKALYHGVSGKWVQMETAEEKRIAIQFSKVDYYCRQRDMLYKGLCEKYKYTGNLPVGNYAFKSPYDFFWVTTTDKAINGTAIIDTTKGYMWQDSSIENVVSTKVTSYDAADFPVANELSDTSWFPGKINSSNGVEEDSSANYRTNNIKAYEDTVYEYNLPADSYVVCYNVDKTFKGVRSCSNSGTFLTFGDTYYIRVVTPSQTTSSHYLRISGYSNYLYLSNKPYRIYTPIGEGELVGINPLMKKFADLADIVYEVNLAALNNAQQAIKDEDNLLTQNLGDLLREGYWQKDDYVEGDEEKLYKDAIDNLKEISKPETNYDISYLDLYAANKGQGFSTDDLLDIEWPDVEITYAVHLVDPEIDINQWAYIDVINKCYDQPWLTTLEVNTKLSLIGQHDFTDVLARIAEVANETKANQSIYKRASALSATGTLTSDLLEGNVKANKTYILGGASNWYTDIKGNIVLEAEDGSGAMMLTGHGILVADSRDSWGDWNFRTGITGKGLTADEVVTGFLSARDALVGSITTDMLHASVGQELEIGSNRALLFYATVSGERPAGGLKTGLHKADGTYAEVGSGDSYIEIRSEETTASGTNPAYINIMTGGLLNIYSGSDMNIKSGADLFIESGGLFTVKSGGDLKIASGGSIDIVASENGKFTVSSPNFHVYANGDIDIKGTVYALAGEIAGFTIKRWFDGSTFKRGAIYSGTDSMSSTASGIYLGTDGVNLGGYLKVSKDGATAVFGSTKMTMDAVAGKIDIAGGDINITANSSINITSGKCLTIASSGDVKIGNSGSSFTVGSDGTNAYMYNGPSSLGAATDGAYYGTDGIWIRGTANNVTHYIKATKSGTVDISGKITADEGSIGGVNLHKSYGLYTGDKTTATSTEAGFLIHKDGAIYLGAYNATLGSTPFRVTSEGALTATSGTIGGWTINSTSLTSNKTGMSKTSNDADIAFWAGNATASSANFYVQQNGKLYANNIEAKGGFIGAWTIGTKLLSASSGSSYVALDGSTDLYPLSGLSSPSDHMYAIWAGGASPNDAPFSVTKDGIVTIQKLRIHTGSGEYRTVDFNDFVYVAETGDTYDWDKLFAKLKFQTVRSISQNTSTGRVTINVSNNSGGTSSWSFNTATSVRLGDGTWSGASSSAAASYTARCFYNYGDNEINVEEKKTVTVTSQWSQTGESAGSLNTLRVYGNYVSVPLQNLIQLFAYELTVSQASWSTDHKAKVTIKADHSAYDSSEKYDILHYTSDASSVWNDSWNRSALAVTLEGSTAGSDDSVNKTLSYDEKWIIKGKYYPADSSIQSNTGKTYVVKAPSDRYSEGQDNVGVEIKTDSDGTKSIHVKNDTTTKGYVIALSTGSWSDGSRTITVKAGSTTLYTSTVSDSVNVDAAAGTLSQFTAKATSSSGAGDSQTYYLVKNGNAVEVHKGSQTGTVVAKKTW